MRLGIQRDHLLPALGRSSTLHDSVTRLLRPAAPRGSRRRHRHVIRMLQRAGNVITKPHNTTAQLKVGHAALLSQVRHLKVSIHRILWSTFTKMYVEGGLSFSLRLDTEGTTVTRQVTTRGVTHDGISIFLVTVSTNIFVTVKFAFCLSIVTSTPSSRTLARLINNLYFALNFVLLTIYNADLFASSMVAIVTGDQNIVD